MSFLQESIKEFDHVVWPTSAETKKYFNIVVSMIVILTVLLFVVGTALSTGLFTLKKQIQPISPTPTTSATPTSSTPQDLKLDNLNLETTPTSGATPAATPVTPVAPAAPVQK